MELASPLQRYELYRDTVLRRPALTPQDAKELAWRGWFGDEGAVQALIERHLWLVVELAERLRPFDREAPARLVAAGNRALMRAAESFRPWGADGEFAEFALDRLIEAMTREALPAA